MKLRLKSLILDHVRLENGISSLRLSLHIMSALGPSMVMKDEYNEAVEELLRDKEIVKVEFTDSQSPRLKTIYFLKGTTFKNFVETPVEAAPDNQDRLANESR